MKCICDKRVYDCVCGADHHYNCPIHSADHYPWHPKMSNERKAELLEMRIKGESRHDLCDS